MTDRPIAGPRGARPGRAARRTLVVGIGSELHRDDAAGRVVAERIDRCDLPGVTVASVVQLVPELAESIAAVDQVVFVDAAVDCDDVTAEPVRPSRAIVAGHHGDPAAVLALASTIADRTPDAHLVRVPATDLSLGTTLTSECNAQVETAILTVTDLIT